MGEKNPTERVRAMLDERGIEHYDHENGEPLRDLSEAGADPATSWRMGGANVCAVPNKQGTFDLWIDNCTPEQAIAATVGVGTCKLVDNDSGPDMHCTACGGGVDDEYRYFMDSWGYSRCPHCGARIIEEATE